MGQLVRHPELEVLDVGVEVQVDEGDVLRRQQDVQRVAVVLLLAPQHRHEEGIVGGELADQRRVLQHRLLAHAELVAGLRHRALQVGIVC